MQEEQGKKNFPLLLPLNRVEEMGRKSSSKNNFPLLLLLKRF
jgi:hypothetical protein